MLGIENRLWSGAALAFALALMAIALHPSPAKAQTGPVCINQAPFGIGYPPSLMDQDLQCWLRVMKTRKLPETPLAQGVEYVAPAGEPGQRDELGFLPSEWLEMSDQQVLAIFLRPKNINYLLDRLKEGSVSSLVPLYLLGDFVTTGEARLAPAFGIAFPACQGYVPGQARNDACTTAYGELRNRIAKAGFGQPFPHGKLSYSWSDFGIAVGRSYYAKPFPRVRWLSFNRDTAYQLVDGTTLIDLARNGFKPARRLLVRLGNTCSGNSYVIGPMQNSGVYLRAAVDWAIEAGDAEAAFNYGNWAQNGSCGADRDKMAALDYTYRAAQMGHAPALPALVTLFANGQTMGRNPRQIIDAMKDKPGVDTQALAQLETLAVKYDKVAAIEGTVIDSPTEKPGIAIVRAVMLRELRWAFENYDGGFNSSLNEFFGNRYEWDESAGRMSMRQGSNTGMDSYSVQQFDISSAKCTPIAGRTAAFRCTSSVSVYIDAGLGQLKFANNVSTPYRTTTDEIVFENGKWRSPTLRTRMLAGLHAPQSTGSVSNPGQSALCRSLGAGVVAAGGNSTSQALSPSTWGC